MREALAVMAKAPRAGTVKTRLIPSLGARDATGLYTAFLRDTAAIVAEVVAQRPAIEPVVAHAPSDAEGELCELCCPGSVFLAQRGDSLSDRLANLFGDLLGTDFGSAVALGVDSPALPASAVVRAFEALARGADLVLGPATDGGYYLIGMRRPRRQLFEVELSTATVLSDTMAVAGVLGLTVELLPEWFDVDTPDDLVRLREALDAHRGAATHTRTFLASLAGHSG
jgi:rSAM/selenodomain-associated transferase 1